MAVVEGPLHSETASGQFAKTTIYQTYRGKSYAKKYAVPGNTPGFDKMNQSAAQLTHQAQFVLIAAAWSAASEINKATWAPIALRDRITRYAAYTRENWRRVLSGRAVTVVWTSDNEKVTAATVINGTPAASVNVLGAYYVATTYNNLPVYYRVLDDAYIIWNGIPTWFLTTPPNLGQQVDLYYRNGSFEGEYGAYGEWTGKVVVASVP
jgi:hypothetical protein